MNSDQEEPQGVAGWLAVLIAGMLVIGPLSNIASMAAELRMIEMQFPVLQESAEWVSFNRAEWIAILMSSAISIYGGFGLLKKRTPDAVATAKMVLWLNYPISVVIVGIAIPATTMSVAAVDKGVVFLLFASLVAASVWTAYLSRSKRVRNTYGLNSVIAPSAPRPAVSEAALDGQPHRASSVQTRPNVVGVEKSKNSVTVPHKSGNMDSIVDEDAIYTQIAQELETGVTDKGLWTRLFADTDGDEQKTKARYIKHRAEKLIAVQRAHMVAQATLRAEVESKLQHEKQLAIDGLSLKTGRCPNSRCEAIIPLTSASCPQCRADFSLWKLEPLTVVEAAKYEQEVQHAYDSLPKGKCPNCKKIIPLESTGCPHCSALFENGAAWKVIPLK